jgi:uncharacterized membrane protein YphA (DoxX/SURF4 family)
VFESFVWDLDGRARLNYAEKDGRPTIDLEPTTDAWEQFRVRVQDHYEFDENQKKAAQKCYDNWVAQLKWYFDTNRDDIVEYFQGLDRRDANEKDAARTEVESLRGQATKIAGEVSAARGPWLASVKKMWTGYGDELNAIATDEQKSAGPLAIGKPARRFLDTETINVIIPYFDTIVGALLILGLFTRLAALAGAGFLFSIVLTQWPGAPGALPVYYQTIEMLALLVLAATAAGRFAGLDFVVLSLFKRCCNSDQGTNS